MLKKCISMLLLVTVLFSFVGCGEDSSSGNDGAENESLGATHTHSYTEEIDEPSCIFSGMKTFTCSCGDYYTEDIPATGVHTWEEATCEWPKLCSECYVAEGEPLGHSWKEATCEDPKECTRCGEKDGWSGTGHTWQAATCKNPETCTKCGETSGSKLSYHNYSDATCTEPEKCKVCGAIGDPADGHSYNWDNVCYNCGKTDPAAEAAYSKCSLSIPSLPASYNERDYYNSIETTIKVTKITYEFTGYSSSDGTVALTIYYSGSKTFDKDGSNVSRRFDLSYKLYDASGNVVEAMDTSITGLAVGDSFSERDIDVYNLKPGKYKLVFLDRQ